MNTMKWIAASALVAGSAFAAVGVAQLDIVVRDFDVSHSDFENFSEEAASGHLAEIQNTAGYGPDWAARSMLHNSCGNQASHTGVTIGANGDPMAANDLLPDYLKSKVSPGPVLKYGVCTGNKTRGYTNASSTYAAMNEPGAKCDGQGDWANDVYYTPGMVQSHLQFADPVNGEYDMYDGVTILKNKDLCDNTNFHEWYKDVAGTNYRINKTLDLPSVGTNLYQVNYNYNNGGYSPLDSIDPASHVRLGEAFCNPEIQNNGKCEQFGPQSLSIFCPPYNYQHAASQTDWQGQNTYGLCSSWLANGGPKSGGAASAAAASAGTLGQQHLRNYAFTMMGYAKFKYSVANQTTGGEVFEFVGDDDMWIFVDGVLVVDLGGTHLAAPGSVNIKTLADNNHGCHDGEPLAKYTNCDGNNGVAWGEGSWHHLHFFYADRQTDGSNLLIRTSLAELAPSKYGQPTITSAIASIENGKSAVTATVNTALSETTLNSLMAQASANKNIEIGGHVDPATASYPMVVQRQVCSSTNVCETKFYGVLVTDFSASKSENAEGIAYKFTGVLVDDQGNVVGNLRNGDALAFNYTGTEGSENMTPFVGEGAAEKNAAIQYWLTHALPIESTSGKKVEGFPDKWGAVMLTVKYEEHTAPQDNNIKRPDFSEQAKKLTDKASGGTLPNNATGELKVVPVTKEMMEQLGLGDPNEILGKTDIVKEYIKDPSKGAAVTFDAGNTTGLCGSSESAIDPCVSLSFFTMQGFRVNVRVFDHLGHFVSQYTQSMDGDDLAKAMGPGQGENCSAENPLYGTGGMLVGLKMYPVSQSGRMLATGPYIYQVTIVRMEGKYCALQAGEPSEVEFIYSRTTDTYTRGYKRSSK